MEWIDGNWFELVQTTGIIGGFLLSAWITRKDEVARKINNLFSSNAAYREIWKEAEQGRVQNMEVDLTKEQITNEERLVVKMLVLHLDTIRRAMKAGVFVQIEGLPRISGNSLLCPFPRLCGTR